jgi:CHRD domain
MRLITLCLFPLAAALAAAAAPAAAQTVHARMQGYQEVPAVSSPGKGEFTAKINQNAGSIFYELSYENLQGQAFMAHIHVGQHSVNGGISVWLCGTPALGASIPAGISVPECPVTTGTVNGTLTAASVVGPGGQLVGTGQFDELIAAIREGVTYVNVHTTAASGGVPGGEIRGQIGGKGQAGGQH